MSLTEFKDRFLEAVLDLMWRQWSSIGAAGQSGFEGRGHIVDPEALLLFSATMARYDQRLFDEVLDWLVTNNRFVNVQRLKTILKKEEFQSGRVISAIAGFLNNERSGLKWSSLANENRIAATLDPLFYLNTGGELPVHGDIDPIFSGYGFIRNPVVLRGMSKPFPGRGSASLLLQIRSIFGIGSRSEILLYMILKGETTISEISEQTYYAWRSVQDVLFEWGYTPMLDFPASRKGRTYRINRDWWRKLLDVDELTPGPWICWPAFYRALEIIWNLLIDDSILESRELEQAAELKQVFDSELQNRMFRAGLASDFGALKHISGVPFVGALSESILGTLNGLLAEAQLSSYHLTPAKLAGSAVSPKLH